MPKLIIFHQNFSPYSYTKNRHAEGKCIKEYAEVDDFFSKFEQNLKHEKIDMSNGNCIQLREAFSS